ncbi:hypothetical protein BJ944DRAFT_267664 [Cunninghamella echinulata]|nr:hypothetical protein BJ944DRAFT_267664 [Cunninghamella echinulata]
MRLSKVGYTLLLYSFVLLIRPIHSQSIKNPSFLEIDGTYYKEKQTTPDYNPNDFRIIQSQIFQTIYNRSLSVDLQLKRPRPIFDFSDACNNQTTFNDLQNWNFNGFNRDSGIQTYDKIALVKRGGGCKWMEKVLNIGQLSTTYNLSVTHIIIYDNQTYGNDINTNFTTSQANGVTTLPSYSQPLPAITDINNMPDNDINANNNTLKITDNYNLPGQLYFVSNNYGLDIIGKIRALNQVPTSAPHSYLFIETLLQEINWTSGTSLSNYITWIIALGAVFFLASFALFLFFRWWRLRQRIRDRDYNIMLEEHHLRMLNQRKLKPLPVSIVNSYPIQNYNADQIKNSSCAICLEDYEENQSDIRLLPCGHGFCVLCIDPWLTQKSTLCPICKYNCLPPELRDEKDIENNDEQPSTSSRMNPSSSQTSSSPSLSTSSTTSSPPNANTTTTTTNATTTAITTTTESVDITDINIRLPTSPVDQENVTNDISIITKDKEEEHKEKEIKENDRVSIVSTDQKQQNDGENEALPTTVISSLENSKRTSHESNLSSLPISDSQPSSSMSPSPRHSIDENKKKINTTDKE